MLRAAAGTEGRSRELRAAAGLPATLGHHRSGAGLSEIAQREGKWQDAKLPVATSPGPGAKGQTNMVIAQAARLPCSSLPHSQLA